MSHDEPVGAATAAPAAGVIHLEGCDAAAVAASIQECSSDTQSLTLRNCALSPDLFSAGNIVSSLEHLMLNNVKLTAALARKLLQSFIAAPSRLQTLDCGHNPKLGPRGLPVVLDCCNNATTTTLRLNSTGLGPFSPPPQVLPTVLHTLDIAGNHLGNAALYKWQQPLAQCKSLCVLDVSDNDLGDDGIRALASVFPTLVRLTATGNGITTWDVTAPHLEYLDLRRNAVGDDGIRAMVDSWNRLEKDGAVAPAILEEVADDFSAEDDENNWESLAPLPLHTLLLAHNRIGSGGSTALAQGLRGRSPAIHTVDLAHNAMDDAGADAWLDAVDDLPALRVLDVTPCRTQVLQLLLDHRGRSAARNDSTSHREADDSNSNDEAADPQVLETLQEALQADDVTEIPSSVVIAITKEFSIPVESRGAFGPRYRLPDSATPTKSWLLRRCGTTANVPSFDVELLADLHGNAHPHLLPIAAYNLEHGCLFYRCHNGKTLHSLLHDTGRRRRRKRRLITPSSVPSLLMSLAEALAFLHDHGCCHGDVQSHTVVITRARGSGNNEEEDVALLTDAGAAGVGTAACLGTTGYRCPRFERGSVEYSSASDVFSLGIVASELVTGKLQNSALSGSPVAWDAFYDLREHPGLMVGASNDVQKVIFSCLTPIVEQRPTAETIVEWLTDT